jgi:hypothetical protein
MLLHYERGNPPAYAFAHPSGHVVWSQRKPNPARRKHASETTAYGPAAHSAAVPQAAPDAPSTVRSLAILFKLPDGEEWRTAMINIPVFTVNTVQGFCDQLLASAPESATGKPDPAKISAFLTKHPETGKALQFIHNQPAKSGFTDSTYNSLNAFRFINAQVWLYRFDGQRFRPCHWSRSAIQAPS